jgi:hypothetical protein
MAVVVSELWPFTCGAFKLNLNQCGFGLRGNQLNACFGARLVSMGGIYKFSA